MTASRHRSKKVRQLRRRQLQANEASTTGVNRVPSSFVFKRGRVGEQVKQLVTDMRKVMSPHTAIRLEERKNNTLRDFIHVAPVLNITHFMIYTQTPIGTNMRICRVPRGPTLTFRVENYSCIRDIVNIQKHPISLQSQHLQYAPLVVLNGFSTNNDNNNNGNNNTNGTSTNHLDIVSSMLQHMYPAIDVSTVSLKQCRRVVIFVRNPSTELIDVRHYLINATPIGINKSIKKIIKTKLPNLSNMSDISDYILNPPQMSDSEVDDTAENKLILSESYYGAGNIKSNKSAIRLQEIGPRMSLSLLKIESGICDGEVLYHSYQVKTEEEKLALQQRKLKQHELKAMRKQQQAANIARKRKESTGTFTDDSIELPDSNVYGRDDKTDIDYYTEAVGRAPDASDAIERARPVSKASTHKDDAKKIYPTTDHSEKWRHRQPPPKIHNKKQKNKR